jgi:phage tail sheath protein FI
VFVEETSFRSKSIEGVSTSTTAFVGLARRGPSGPTETPELLTRFADFERIYGGVNDLTTGVNYLAHAALAYFNEGGARLYVTRAAAGVAAASADVVATKTSKFTARFVGDAGNGSVRVALNRTPIKAQAASNAIDGSLIRINSATPAFALRVAGAWKDASSAAAKDLSSVTDTMQLLTVTVTTTDKDGGVQTYEGLGLDPAHKQYIGTILHHDGNGRDDQVSRLFYFDVASTVTAVELAGAFTPTNENMASETPHTFTLSGGTDVAPDLTAWTDALNVIAGIDDVSIVAAPGHTEYAGVADGIRLALIQHAEKARSYRIAVLDVPKGKSPTEARDYKGNIDSKYAALYYPWVVTPNPLFNPADPKEDAELVLPPSGMICGIYARSDIERGVFKAPANEVVRSALRFERLVTNGEQEMLNPLGVNCLRYMAGRGNLVWGARTTSSDPEWKYVNIRRYFLYLEHSIDKGSQWAVFEPNGERLWANVTDTITSFVYNEWVNGALLGDKPEQAFFVKCDRSTMTQNDLDNGRLICLIGVAAIKPAEFVIFRIGQKTADART